MPRNPGVRLHPRRRHPTVVTPLEPRPQPLGLGAIKAELGRRWSGTGLLDVFNEADLRIGFTDAFATAASREATDRDEARPRHRDGGGTPVRGQPRPKRGRLRVHQAAGFQLLPRLKAISAQRLYLPEAGGVAAYPNLACILARQIDWALVDWALVEQQYDEFVRRTTAMVERTVDPEAILRRFTRSDVQHLTYKAVTELGKAVTTGFLCHYLGDEALRGEIHEGLNVVETWNLAIDFIFFGKGGEVASHRDPRHTVHYTRTAGRRFEGLWR